jgi:hypothetical protein
VSRKSRIYYYKSENDKDKHFNDYDGGFNLESTIRLTILTSIDIVLKAKIENGFVASVGLNKPIDIFVLQLAGRNKGSDGKYTGSPTLNIDTTKDPAEFEFSTGLNFFQMPFFTTTVMVKKLKQNGDMQISGNLKSESDLDIFGRLNLYFTYSKTGGFKVDNWSSFTIISDIINFVEKIKKIYNESDFSSCGKLADFVTDVLFKTDYSISPSFSIKDDGLYFVISGKYFLKLLNSEEPFVTVTFPDIDFKIINTLSFSELPNKRCNR